MIIRRAHSTDAATISRLGGEIFYETFAASNRPEDMAAYLAEAYTEARQRRELEDPTLTTLLAEADGEAIAFAQLRLQCGAAAPGGAPAVARDAGEGAGATPSPSMEIVRFYVHSSWHGRGVARALMDAVEAAADVAGAETIWLGVWEHNLRAIRFYEKCGFRRTGQQPFLLGSDLQTDLVMTKERKFRTAENQP